MRKILDGIYNMSAYLSATAMISIALIVIVQIGFRITNSIYFSLKGEILGLIFPSSAEFVGYCMVATSFLGLAYTLRKDGHIRVSILLKSVPNNLYKTFELICLALGTAFLAFVVYHSGLFVYDSYKYDDLSAGIIAVPLYIPQLFMLLGLVIMFIAFLDDFVCFIMGREISYASQDAVEIGRGGSE